MKREELDRLAELEAKATPGPQKITRASRGDYITLSGDDARLAVALRNAAPALLAAARERDEQAAELARLRAELERVKSAPLDVCLDEAACELLLVFVHPDPFGHFAEVRLQWIDGHSGRGLYVSLGEHPEEGSELLALTQEPPA